MSMIGKVRRMHFREGKSVREIARLTSLSRNTVRTWLREPEVKERRYRRPEASTQLAPFAESLRQALTADAHRPKRDRRTAKALFETFRAQGYAGCYSRVTDFVRAWRAGEGQAAEFPADGEPVEARHLIRTLEQLFGSEEATGSGP